MTEARFRSYSGWTTKGAHRAEAVSAFLVVVELHPQRLAVRAPPGVRARALEAMGGLGGLIADLDAIEGAGIERLPLPPASEVGDCRADGCNGDRPREDGRSQ